MIAPNTIQRGWAAVTPHGKIRVDTVAIHRTTSRRSISADVGRSWAAMVARGWKLIRVKVEAVES